MSLVVRKAVQSLLSAEQGSADDDTPTSAATVIASLESLCTHLQQLSSSKATSATEDEVYDDDSGEENNLNHSKQEPCPETTITVRSALAIPSQDMARLTHLLSTLQGDRVSNESLLPLTYDDEANEQVMQSSAAAMTLTKTSLTAAAVYAKLLSMPGALGAGLVQMQALGGLSALLRRWRVECCGRETDLGSSNNTNENAATKKKKTKRGRPNRRSKNSPNTRPKKSNRRSVRFSDTDNSDDDDSSDSDDGNGDFAVQESEGTQLQPQQLYTMGLRVALLSSQILLQKELLSWSCEARDVIINAVASVLATAAALTSSKRGGDADTCLAAEVVAAASEALQCCLLNNKPVNNKLAPDLDPEESLAEDDSSAARLMKHHEATVSIMRGLYPIIAMKEVLPKGENGKLAAASAASEALEGFMQGIVDDLAKSKNRLSFRSNSSRLSVSPTLSPADAATPKSSRKLRMSLGGGGGGSHQGLSEQYTPPKLKASKTTPRPPSSATPFAGTPRPVLKVILGILQKLATDKGLDKSSARTLIVDTLHRCLKHLPILERSHFLTFLIKLCHSTVSVHRLAGVEIVGRIITEEWLWTDHFDSFVTKITTTADVPTPASSSRRKSLTPLMSRSSENMPEALFSALHGRLQDRIPSIRTASTGALMAVIQRLAEESTSTQPAWAAGLIEVLAEEGDVLVDSLRKRTIDGRATVRRGAVETLAELLVLGKSAENLNLYMAEVDKEILSKLCMDNSVMVRRAAAEALTRLLEYDTVNKNSVVKSRDLESAWSSAVLTMVLDSETTCVSKGVELVERVLLVPILDREHHTPEQTEASWRILADLSDGSKNQGGVSRSQTEALRTALGHLVASPSAPKDFFKKLLETINNVCVSSMDESSGNIQELNTDARRSGAWCLFEALVGHSKNTAAIARIVKRSMIDIDFIGTSWEAMLDLSSRSSGETKMHLLRSMKKCFQVLSKLAPCVDPALTQKSSCKLKELLKKFSFPPEIASAAISSLVATTVVSSTSTGVDPKVSCNEWIQEIYSACENRIAGFVSNQGRDTDLPGILRAIFTVGELSLVGFSASDDEDRENRKNDDSESDPIRGLRVRPSGKLLELVQACAPNALPGSELTKTPESIRAHAFITTGKLCLRDAALAKRSLNIFARELYENMQQGSWKVQSNALIVLGDLCVKYTNMVDRYLPIMAACMQAGVSDFSSPGLIDTAGLIEALPSGGAALVRKHAILLLSSLLLQDYVKWRGLLFHRFLVAAVDEDDEVANLAQMLLCGPLITKQPKLFANQFVESLFVLNRCTAHPIYVAAASTGDGGSGISVGFDGINLTGEVGRIRRMEMYKLMVAHMSDEEKIGATARIAKEVLGSALESGSDLNRVCTVLPGVSTENDAPYESAANVLSDALAFLSDPSMRVGKSGKNQVEDDIEDPNVSINSSQKIRVAKGRLMSNLSRKHLIEIILPILCNLKDILQKSCSTLLKDLMSFLVFVFRQYKTEVKEQLANDPTLLQEIEYDARQFQKAQRSQSTQVRTDQSPASATPS